MTASAMVIGPTLVDIYLSGRAARIDQTAPVPVVNVESVMIRPGGAANAALSLASFGMPVSFVTVMGSGDSAAAADSMRQVIENAGIRLCVCFVEKYLHPTKTRVFVGNQLVGRYDLNSNELKVEDHVRDTFARAIMGSKEKPSVLLISDYGNAVITEEVLGVVLRYAKEAGIPVVADPAPRRLQHYKDCHIITPNVSQVCDYTRASEVGAAAVALYKELSPKYLFMTAGDKGCIVVDESMRPRHCPAVPAKLADSCGCGDVFAASLAYGVAAGMSLDELARYSSAAGSAAAEAFGAAPVGALETQRKLLFYRGAQGKIINMEEALRLRKAARQAGKSFGVTNGVFDLMHAGHMDSLSKARNECDFLLVLLNSDVSAAAIKRQPVNPEDLRANMLANLSYVDAVVLFDSESPREQITRLLPDVVAKGPGYSVETTAAADIVCSNGGRFVSTAPQYDTSTTKTILEIAQREGGEDNSQTAAPSSGP